MLFLALNARKDAPAIKGLPTEVKDKLDYAITFYQQQIIAHFDLEKEKLWRVIRGKDEGLDLLISEFLRERDRLIVLFEALSETKSPEDDLHELGIELEKHIRREEREVFQRIQEVLTEEELEKLEL